MKLMTQGSWEQKTQWLQFEPPRVARDPRFTAAWIILPAEQNHLNYLDPYRHQTKFGSNWPSGFWKEVIHNVPDLGHSQPKQMPLWWLENFSIIESPFSPLFFYSFLPDGFWSLNPIILMNFSFHWSVDQTVWTIFKSLVPRRFHTKVKDYCVVSKNKTYPPGMKCWLIAEAFL